MAADGPGMRVLWDIEGSVRLTPRQKIDTKASQKIICIGMGGLLFWELDNVWSIYWKDNWIFIYLLFFLSTWKKLKGLHCDQVPASYFDTCRKSEVRKWCIFIIIHIFTNLHLLSLPKILVPVRQISVQDQTSPQRRLSRPARNHQQWKTKNNRYQHQGVEQNLAFKHEVLDFSEKCFD